MLNNFCSLDFSCICEVLFSLLLVVNMMTSLTLTSMALASVALAARVFNIIVNLSILLLGLLLAVTIITLLTFTSIALVSVALALASITWLWL